MSKTAETGLLAIDLGSSLIKLGWFAPTADCESAKASTLFPIAAPKLPHPEENLAVAHRGNEPNAWTSEIRAWRESFPLGEVPILLASVRTELIPQVESIFDKPIRALTASDLSLEVELEQPEKVGIDRLLCAVAANRIRKPDSAAIVISTGTAITINLISAEGAFQGGTIMPGLHLAAEALHAGTSSLPKLESQSLKNPPAAVGKSTHEAIEAGLFWGAVGAINQIVSHQIQATESPVEVFITGGDARLLAQHLQIAEVSIKHVPEMVLSGIAIAAEEIL